MSVVNGHDGEESHATSLAADAETMVSSREGETIHPAALLSDKGFVKATGLEGFANSPMVGDGEEVGSGDDSEEDDEGVEMRVLLR